MSALRKTHHPLLTPQSLSQVNFNTQHDPRVPRSSLPLPVLPAPGVLATPRGWLSPGCPLPAVPCPPRVSGKLLLPPDPGYPSPRVVFSVLRVGDELHGAHTIPCHLSVRALLLPPRLLNQDLQRLHLLSLFLPLAMGTSRSLCLNLLHSLRVRETDSQGEHTSRHMAGIAGAVMAVLLTMGAGLYFWKIHGKKKETEAGTGAGLEDGRRVREDDICYAELSQQESQEGGDKGVHEQPLEEKIPVTTIYSEVHRPGQAAKVI